MNVIIPVAGIGKRLRPHTYSTPKVLLMVGGKPILGHILDRIVGAHCNTLLHKVIFIVGYMGDKVREYVSENYDFPADYIEQKEQFGLGHAVWLTKEIAGSEPCLIVYGDTIFEASFKEIIGSLRGGKGEHLGIDGWIGVKEVDDPRRFGIVEVEGDFIKKFVEKPERPTSNLAIVGVNFIRNSELLFNSLEKIMKEGRRTAGEFQLTDAFELMVECGAKFKWFLVEEWYDCGKAESLLSTNRALLVSHRAQVASNKYKGSVIKPPVFIHESAKIEHSTIGPNVSIDRHVYIKDSMVSDSVINQGARIEDSRVEHSIIGASAVAKGVSGVLNIGECSEVISGGDDA